MTIKIDKDIQIPATYGKYTKYPFRHMKIGDSFAIERGDEVACVRQAASHYARRSGHKIKFSIRKFENIYRCWRVE